MIGFQKWIETIISSKDMAEYRSRYNDSETAFLWQSLMFRISYRCGYCVSVCPAGEEPKAIYLQDKAAYVQQVLRPLQDKAEPVYVSAGSKAETAAKRNPQKQVKSVLKGKNSQTRLLPPLPEAVKKFRHREIGGPGCPGRVKFTPPKTGAGFSVAGPVF